MDNAIFRKLQEAIEQPCRSKEWFGLAEQVINTVYALGEHPDVFCNDLIKKLTVKAFSQRQKSTVPAAQPEATTDEKDPDAMDEDEPPDPHTFGKRPSYQRDPLLPSYITFSGPLRVKDQIQEPSHAEARRRKAICHPQSVVHGQRIRPIHCAH